MTEESHHSQHIINKLKLDTQGKPPHDKDCPACGARKAKQAGLTHCAFCGYEFRPSDPPRSKA